MEFIPTNPIHLALTAGVIFYIFLVRHHRFHRRNSITSRFTNRPLSSMTVSEAHSIVRELRELEFPYSMHNATKLSLLKTGAISSMTKLFTATRQLNHSNMTKRAADTEVLLSEVHDRLPGSEMHLRSIARMNYLHARYRAAGKILDTDMLHTLGSAVVDIFGTIEAGEWRGLTEVERCAVGVFHRALGDAMEIPWGELKGNVEGWEDGGGFAEELVQWTREYELEKARPAESNRVIGRSLMELGSWGVPRGLKGVVERVIASKLERHMRVSMGFPEPGLVIEVLVKVVVALRRFVLRYLCLPRSESRAVRVLEEHPDPVSGLYTINLWIAEPWYVKPTFKNRWGAKALFARWFGSGAVPMVNGSYREDGYDLRTIGPAAQEKRGLEQSEEIYQGLKAREYAGVCPFHR